MNRREQDAYRVVITLSLPEDAEAATVELVLMPSSAVIDESGRSVRLADCTLAELRQYAQALEAEVWRAYDAARLPELLDGQEPGLTVNVETEHSESPKSQQAGRAWLDDMILMAPEVDLESPEEDAADSARRIAGEAIPEDEQPALPEPNQDEGEAVPVVEERGHPEPEHSEAESIPVNGGPAHTEPDLADKVAEPEGPAAEDTELEKDVSTPPEPEQSEGQLADDQVVEEGEESPPSGPAVAAVPTVMRILGRRRPLNHPTWSAVDILINEPAFRNAQAHAVSSLDKEVAGVLVGPPPEKQPDGRYIVHISDTIIAKHTRMQGASVTYTPESWRYVNDRLLEMYPDETAVIVGWYHTHPGFGIFLSGMDRFIHQHFFNQLWQVALVLDPLARRSGFFAWDRQNVKVDAYEFPWPKWATHSW